MMVNTDEYSTKFENITNKYETTTTRVFDFVTPSTILRLEEPNITLKAIYYENVLRQTALNFSYNNIKSDMNSSAFIVLRERHFYNGTRTTPPWLIFLKDPMEVKSPHLFVPMFVPIIVTHAITFIFGIIGNSSMVASLLKGRVSRNITSLFLTSLAAADFLLLLICVPLETLQYFLWTPQLSLPVCKLKSFVELLSAVASVLNLTAVSLERYLVIVYPMQSRSLCTLSNCRKAVFVVWVASLLISVPAGITHEIFATTYYNKTFNVTIYECEVSVDHELKFALYRLAIVFTLPGILMSVFYVRVIKTLWISTKAVTAMTKVYSTRYDSRNKPTTSVSQDMIPSNSSSSMVHSGSNSPHSGISLIHPLSIKKGLNIDRCGDVKIARKQVIKMLILVIVLFMLCWGPKIILDVLRGTGSDRLFTDHIYNLQVFFGLLPFIHSCLNPVIYTVMSTNFRRILRRSCVSRSACSTIFGILCSQSDVESHGNVCNHLPSTCTEFKEHFKISSSNESPNNFDLHLLHQNSYLKNKRGKIIQQRTENFSLTPLPH